MSCVTRVVFGLALVFAATGMSLPAAAAGNIRVLNDDVHFPEGPVWKDGKLYYVEYDRNTVTVWDGKANAIFAELKGCGPSAVIFHGGEFLVTCYDNGTIGRLSATGKALPAWDHDREGNRFDGPNDFAPDRHGGLYFTTSGHPGKAIDGCVFHVTAGGVISRVAAKLNSTNGIVVSLDGRQLYVIETEANHLLRYAINAEGQLSDAREFLNLDELTHHVTHIYPDGVKMDSKGFLYIGQNPRDPQAPLAGTIFVVDAGGHLLRSLKLPSPGVPNLTFSPDEHTVYVTALDQLDKSPYRGKIYAVPNE